MRLRLYENYRFVLYAPFYAAHAIGAYAAEGLDSRAVAVARAWDWPSRHCSTARSTCSGQGRCGS